MCNNIIATISLFLFLLRRISKFLSLRAHTFRDYASRSCCAQRSDSFVRYPQGRSSGSRAVAAKKCGQRNRAPNNGNAVTTGGIGSAWNMNKWINEKVNKRAFLFEKKNGAAIFAIDDAKTFATTIIAREGLERSNRKRIA